jgi:hypothetical protein
MGSGTHPKLLGGRVAGDQRLQPLKSLVLRGAGGTNYIGIQETGKLYLVHASLMK